MDAIFAEAAEFCSVEDVKRQAGFLSTGCGCHVPDVMEGDMVHVLNVEAQANPIGEKIISFYSLKSINLS